MRINLFTLSLSLIFFIACNEQKRPQTAMDTARTFIESSLDGDFKAAEPLLMPDSLNRQMFQTYESYYAKLPKNTRSSYAKASYEIDSYEEKNDSTVVVHYSNDFMHQPMKLKVIKQAGVWWIDFKDLSASDSTHNNSTKP
jgi:hypothetical protein